jgi:two-component system sensor histidine kinase YesM
MQLRGLKLGYGIRFKLFLSYMVLLTLLIVGVGFFYTRQIDTSMTLESEYYLGKISNQLVNHLDFYVDEMKNTMMTVVLEKQYSQFLQESYVDDSQRHANFNSLNNLMLSLVANRSYNDLFLIIRDRNYILSSDSQGSTTYLDDKEFVRSSFFANMKSSGSMVKVVDAPELGHHPSRSYGFAVALDSRAVVIGAKPDNAFIVITSTVDFFDNLVRNVADKVVDLLVIVKPDGGIVYNSALASAEAKPSDLGKTLNAFPKLGSNRITLSNHEYFVQPALSRSTGWNLYFLSSSDRIRLGRDRVVFGGLALLALALALSALAAFVISGQITRPITRLMSLMRRVEGDDLTVRAQPGGNDELGNLNRSFNAMITRMDFLVNELMQSKILTHEAELYALQQQINPHFLYNTLETINSLTNQGRRDEVLAIVRKMAGIFRYCIHGGRKLVVRLSEELRYVKDYLDIQLTRFGDRIEVSYEIDPAILELAAVKFILQPLVENSLRHGFALMNTGAKLSLKGSLKEGNVELTVTDNGKGIEAEVLAQLEHTLASVESDPLGNVGHIGLRNVHARLQLQYRQDYGLVVSSSAGKGTTVTLTFPRQEMSP